MQKPNIIMIILDTARAKNFSCYGYHKNTTPYLDDFCATSNLFKNAFTPAIWTIPSHASIFTGTYPSKHGALNLHRFLDSRYTTLAELLSSHGYDTVGFSNNNFVSLKEFGLSQGFNLMEGFNYPKNKLKKIRYKVQKWFVRSDDTGAYVTNQFVRDWVKQKRNPEKPFFLFLNYMEPHAPYIHVSKRFSDMYIGKTEKKILRNINQDRQKYLTRSIEIAEHEFDILRSVYDAQISYLDFMIKKLLDTFKSNGILDNSMIIITSDHGDMIGEHSLMHHSYSVYEELIRVPLIVKLPGNSDNGKDYDYLASLVDIFPTIADLLGIENGLPNEQIQGYNLFLNENPSKREYIFVECERPKNEFLETYPDFDFSVFDQQLLAIRSKKYKYIWTSDNKNELFDLENDPSEQINLVETMPLLAHQLEKNLFDWYNSFEKASFEKDYKEKPLNADIKERLKALGYF